MKTFKHWKENDAIEKILSALIKVLPEQMKKTGVIDKHAMNFQFYFKRCPRIFSNSFPLKLEAIIFPSLSIR